MPCITAGCSMADMAGVEMVKALKKEHPDACVVCYINSTYEVKAYCDVTVTSSSAVDIIKNIKEKKIIFLPDKNLGEYISKFFTDKEFILWDGFCKYHNNVDVEDILKIKKEHGEAKILVHSECPKEVRNIADYVGSTSGIIDYASNCKSKDFIIGTEEGIL